MSTQVTHKSITHSPIIKALMCVCSGQVDYFKPRKQWDLSRKVASSNNPAWTFKEVLFALRKNKSGNKHSWLYFVWSYFQVFIVCWGNILLGVNFAQAGHQSVLRRVTVGVQIWHHGTVRMCDKSGNLCGVDIIFGHSGRETGKGLSLGTDTQASYKGMWKRKTDGLRSTQRVFALGIIFQLAWHVREAALLRKPAPHSKQNQGSPAASSLRVSPVCFNGPSVHNENIISKV